MYRWLVAHGVRVGYRRLIDGRPGVLLRAASKDIEFVFPGHSSFAAHLRGREPLRQWLQRFVALGPEFIVHDVLVTGAPWNTRVAVRFSDAIGEDYHNDGVEYLRLRWGRVQSVHVFLDTEVVSTWEAQHAEFVAVSSVPAVVVPSH